MFKIKIKHDIEIGEIYGDMEIIEYRGRTKKHGNRKYLVKCVQCGYEKEMKDSHIKSNVGTTHGLGCDKEKLKIKVEEIYDDIKIIEKLGKYKYSNNTMFLVECLVCGETREMKDSRIRGRIGTKHGKSCVHSQRQKNPLKIGDCVDDMIVIDHEPSKRRFKVKCNICGRERFIHDSDLYSKRGTNHYTTCDHIGNSSRHVRLYNIYSSIVQRTRNPNNIAYKNYGGRGIKNKFKSFNEFIDTMSTSYYEHVEKYGVNNTTIDRIDNDGDYSPDNCRWATYKEQRANQRIYITQYEFKAISPEGKEYISNNQNKFAQEHGLRQSSIGRCLQGKQSKHRGWKFEKL